MRKTFVTAVAIVISTTALLVACNDSKPATEENKPLTQDSLIKRGDYLVNAMGCDDCHTPKKMGPRGPEFDMTRRFAGHPANEPLGKIVPDALKEGWVLFGMGLTVAVGPFGTSYAANLSSDSTGIGMWTQEQFVKSIRSGIAKGIDGNRPLLPPMPWNSYKNLSDDDLKSVFAYLKTTKPVKNVVPQPEPPVAAE